MPACANCGQENPDVAGRRPEGDGELQRALAFYHSVDATAYLREGEAVLARTA